MNEMPRRQNTDVWFFDDAIVKTSKAKGRTNRETFYFGRAWFTNRKKGLVRYTKTSTGGGRSYRRDIELNDEERPKEVMKKLWGKLLPNIRRLK